MGLRPNCAQNTTKTKGKYIMSFDVVNYNPKTDKFSWGSNCLPGEPNEYINNVPQEGDLYILSITSMYEYGDTEVLAFDPVKGTISLWLFFGDFGVFEELEILGKWDTPVISKEEYEKMKEHAFNVYNMYELEKLDKYMKEN
jgi:hypothetical protein